MIALSQFAGVLNETQWLPEQSLGVYQRKPLGKLLRHAYETVPFYRDRLAVLFRGDGTIDWDRWPEVPLLRRSDIQDRAPELVSARLPENHGTTHEAQSSGTTGSPIKVTLTTMHEISRGAVCDRYLGWHGVDGAKTLATIRPLRADEARYPDGDRTDGWPEFGDVLGRSGPFLRLNSNTPISDQAEWIARNKPDYLYTLASNAGALASHFAANPAQLNGVALKGLMSYAEIVSDELRDLCRGVFGLEIIDCYSARETGYIALQCPDHRNYHLQSETIKTEILDDGGFPCGPGETGRVVVTPLYNYAMPLIRYEIRDHATVGEPCPCGRGLPVLTRIAGRTRNLFRLPNGALVAPGFKTVTLAAHLAPRQWQIAQTGPLEIEVRLVQGVAEEDMDFDGMTDYIRALLHCDFAVKYRLLDSIPLRPGGKHEDYVCELLDDF